MIKFDNVSKRYAGGHEALSAISFEISKGEMAFITGRSGAGKSSLLKLILAMERASTGAFAARPFLYAGMYYGLGGGMLATMLQFAVYIGFNSALQDLLQLYESNFHLQGFGFTSIAALLLGGSAIGWLGALLASFRQIAAMGP
jgi:energy-coupling factor transporter ATP-binding protein EcfA2